MVEKEVAGVAGLPQASNINGCDTETGPKTPANTAGNPRECRTFLALPFVSACCGGERCFCGQPATAKVEEAIFDDDPRRHRHPLTSYVCAGHFGQIMGPAGGAGFDLGIVDDRHLAEVDSRLLSALQDAGHSALGMPSSVDTIRAMLARAGLALVLA